MVRSGQKATGDTRANGAACGRDARPGETNMGKIGGKKPTGSDDFWKVFYLFGIGLLAKSDNYLCISNVIP